MDSARLDGVDIGVVGTGTMGAGIAQVAAAAGHRVLLWDSRGDAAEEAHERVAASLARRVAAGKASEPDREALLARLSPVSELEDLSGCGVVIEAILESLDEKRALFSDLERFLMADSLIATNTSSLSVTAVARYLKNPGRCIGMHFFNPAPAMKLVEIVRGLATTNAAVERAEEFVRAWGKTPVRTDSSPGFIVNRIARPFYAETLWLLHEKRADPNQLDTALRGAGFRMGPCELMDLIGHDVNYAVTTSMFEAFFADRRFLPSPVQRQLVEGGLLGRKSGRGFYHYPAEEDATKKSAGSIADSFEAVTIRGAHPTRDSVAAALESAGILTKSGKGSSPLELCLDFGTRSGLTLALTDGRPAGLRRLESGRSDYGVFDLPANGFQGDLVVAFARDTESHRRNKCLATLRKAGIRPIEVADTPGLVVARTVAMLVNEAADAVQQGVCTTEDADTAMKLGVNYPLGPFEWAERFGIHYFVSVLEQLRSLVSSERYRVSPWLLEKVWSNIHG